MIAYRDAVPADGPALSVMARQSFSDAFGALYAPADLVVFLDTTFGETGLPTQIGDPAYRIRLAIADDEVVGFAKLGPVLFPGDWPDDAVELHQLYVLADRHGAGVGPALMDWAIATARGMGGSALILSVYIDNHRARAFYARYGFVDIGRYDFAVGDHIDEDRIMRMPL